MARFLILSAFVGFSLLASGCRQQDEIRHYTVPKQSEIDRLAGDSGETSGSSKAGETQRMLAAIVLRPSQGWFFKLLGPQQAVDSHADAFNEFLKSVQFQDDATPGWSLPAGWIEQPGNQFRYATLEIGGTGLEVTVSTLPRGDGEESEYVLSNINRWRGQVGLDPIAPNELQRETKQVEIDGDTATLVDLVGHGQGGSMTAQFASDRGMSGAPPVASGGNSAGLKYDVPGGWEEEAATGFRKASFRIREGEESSDVSVSDLDASAGDLLPNVNRWRGQVGLEPTTERDVEQHVETIAVGTHEGQYIEMFGDAKATSGVIVKVGDRAWFIKLTGDKNLV
ncbi:MAG: hypothetical protein ACREHD_17170, partial [Pirellulales bacterium]